MDGQGYGNEQAIYTMNRAAYGDIPAAMMSGAGIAYGGAASGARNMMADIGRMVMPVTYAAPARAMVGYYGTYQQPTGFFRSGAAAMGIADVPRGTTAMEYTYGAAGDFGERLGGGVAGAAATAGGMLFSVTGGRVVGGALGAAVGSVLGPMGTAAGAWLGANVGGYVLGAMGAGAVSKAVEERRQIQNFLEQSSFRYVEAGSPMSDPFVGGMNRQSRQETAEFIRSMDIKDKTLNMGDLTQILQQGTQLGMFTGTRDAQDFQRRFKDITESVKTVTKLLHQTLEEGMKTIADLKSIGVDPSRAREVAMQSDAMGKVAGRTAQEMVGLGLQGAEMFRGTGVQMGIGFQASQMNLAAVRAARDFGTLSQEAISQAGGEEALALRMAAGGLSFAQSQQGRGFGAAFFQPGQGLNAGAFMQNMMAGGGNFIQNVQNAAQNLSSPARLIEYQANQEKIMTQMGAKFGGRGLEMAMLGSTAAFADYIAEATGANKTDAFRLALKQQGKSTAEIDAYMAQIKDPEKMFKSMQEGVEMTTNKLKMDEASENFVLTRMGAAVGDKVKGVIDLAARPLNSIIDSMAQGVQNFTREQIYGAVQGTARGVDLGVRFERDKATERALAAMGPVDLNQSALFARSAGNQLAGALEDNPELQRLTGIYTFVGDRDKLSGDQVVLERGVLGALSGKVTYTDKDMLERGRQRLRTLSMTEAEAKRMQAAGMLDKVQGKGLLDIFAEGKAGTIRNTEDLLKTMFGTTDVSQQQMAFAILETKGTSLEKALNETRTGAQKAQDGSENMKILQLKQGRDAFDAGKAMLENKGDIKLADGVAELLAKANEFASKGDPKGERDYINQAKALQAKKTGDDIGSIDKKINNAYAGSQLALEKVKLGAIKMQDVQQSRGASNLSRAVEEALFTEEGVKLDEATRRNVSSAAALLGTGNVADIKGILADKELSGALKKLDVGAGIIEQATRITGLESAIKPGMSDKQLRETLSDTFKDEKQLVEMMKLYKSEGKDAVVNEALKSFQENMTTQGGIASASGQASTSGDANVQSASQMAALQTSINVQTLSAMQGLAKKLGVN